MLQLEYKRLEFLIIFVSFSFGLHSLEGKPFLHTQISRPNQEQAHKDVGRNLSPNPNQEQPQEPRNKPTNTYGKRRRRIIRTPTLGTNPQTTTHGRNHTHFRNKPTNHKNGFGFGWERWARVWTTVDGGDDGRRKSQGGSTIEVQRAKAWVHCFWLI